MTSAMEAPASDVNTTELQLRSHIRPSPPRMASEPLPIAAPRRLSYTKHRSDLGGASSPVFANDELVDGPEAACDPEDPQFAGIPALLDDQLSSYSPPKSWGDETSTRALSLPRYLPRVKHKGLFSARKGCVVVFLLVLLLFLIGLIVGIKVSKTCRRKRIPVERVEWRHDYQPDLSIQMQETVSPGEMRVDLKILSGKVHQAGSPANMNVSNLIYNMWSHKQFDELFFDNYTVQLSVADELQANTVAVFEAGKKVIDCESSSKPVGKDFPFYGYTPNGTVEAEFVFINYGHHSDLNLLKSLNISLKGRIAVARSGSGFRSGIVSRASAAGAVGVVIYPDPADFAFNKSQVFPRGWLLPGDAPLFGTMKGGGGGDPLTPDLPAVDGTHRAADPQRFKMPKVPVQSMGYDDARRVLARLRGQPVPDRWNQSLASHVGPTAGTTLRIVTHNRLVTRQIRNVIAVLRGRLEPDRVVVVGNHFDAWLYGAIDPLSGTIIMRQASKAFGDEMVKGYEPRRTLVFAAWDAEEMGLIGSTEFTERLVARLGAQGVAYVNLDCPVKGNYSFLPFASPLLRRAIVAAAGAVKIDNATGWTLLDDWKKKLPGEDGWPELPLLGGGSDQVSFLFRLGIPSVYPNYFYNGFLPNNPTYHTKYDAFDYVSRVIDPTFEHHALVARVLIDLILRLVDSAILPFSVEQYPRTMLQRARIIKKDSDKYEVLKSGKIDLKYLFSAIANLQNASDAFTKYLDQLKNSTNPLQLRRANDILMQVPRVFLWPEGLPNRAYYKNILLSPSLTSSYRGSFFSGFMDGLYLGKKTGEWDHAYRQYSILINAIRGATLLLKSEFK